MIKDSGLSVCFVFCVCVCLFVAVVQFEAFKTLSHCFEKKNFYSLSLYLSIYLSLITVLKASRISIEAVRFTLSSFPSLLYPPSPSLCTPPLPREFYDITKTAKNSLATVLISGCYHNPAIRVFPQLLPFYDAFHCVNFPVLHRSSLCQLSHSARRGGGGEAIRDLAGWLIRVVF